MFIFIFLGYVYISIMIRGVRDLLGVVDVAGLEVELESETEPEVLMGRGQWPKFFFG
jgi:hypothetical protein